MTTDTLTLWQQLVIVTRGIPSFVAWRMAELAARAHLSHCDQCRFGGWICRDMCDLQDREAKARHKHDAAMS